MPAWLIPALKAILPHVGTIVSAAKPVFTGKAASNAANQASLVQQQIAELQAAASANDAHIRELAGQLRATVEALEKEEALAAARHRWIPLLCIATAVMSLIALCAALYALAAR
jgi:hypothetical protein